MSSYSLLTALESFIYDGPKAILGFKHKIHVHDFKAFFSTAEGWGSYRQKIEGSAQECEINLKHGQLNLKTLLFETPENLTVKAVKVLLEKKELTVDWSSQNAALEVTLKKHIYSKKVKHLMYPSIGKYTGKLHLYNI